MRARAATTRPWCGRTRVGSSDGCGGELGGEAFPYLWVPEWHPGGHGLHLHFAVGRYVRQSLIRDVWGRLSRSSWNLRRRFLRPVRSFGEPFGVICPDRKEEPPWRRPYRPRGAVEAGSGLPPRVQEALGELVGAAQEGLLALSVGVGLGVLAELMEEEVVEVVGPKGKHDPERVAVGHGHEPGEVTLGGRRVGVERPRARLADGSGELRLSSSEHFACRDPLSRVVLERMLAGVSCRCYRRTQEPVGEEVEQAARSSSKSSVSRSFVERTGETLAELLGRRLDDVRLAVLMLDGIELKGRTNVVCLGITTEGVKIPLGLWEGSSENATVATALLSDLVERGLDPEQGILFVVDGSKALRKAIRSVFGERAPVQRCLRHKERNVLEHLPERDRPPVKRRLRRA